MSFTGMIVRIIVVLLSLILVEQNFTVRQAG